jgi:hypothetical protein
MDLAADRRVKIYGILETAPVIKAGKLVVVALDYSANYGMRCIPVKGDAYQAGKNSICNIEYIIGRHMNSGKFVVITGNDKKNRYYTCVYDYKHERVQNKNYLET